MRISLAFLLIFIAGYSFGYFANWVWTYPEKITKYRLVEPKIPFNGTLIWCKTKCNTIWIKTDSLTNKYVLIK